MRSVVGDRDWQTDWTSFVENVAGDLDAGHDNKSLSAKYGGQRVTWIGIVGDIQIDAEYAPSVVMKMPAFRTKLRNGYEFIAGHVSVRVDDRTKETWRRVQAGARVRFECEIVVATGPFDGVKAVNFADEKESWLEIGIRNGRHLGTVT